MKVRTPAVLVAAVAAAAMLLAGCTPPLANDFVYRDATVGLQGGTIDVTVTFTCKRGFSIAFGTAHISQSRNGRLAQGDGSFVKAFPGAPCTGGTQGARITLFNSSPWAFTTGTAAVDGDVTLFDDATGDLPVVIAKPRAINVVQADAQSRPAQKSRPSPDPRYTS
jgi:hypothetical protein